MKKFLLLAAMGLLATSGAFAYEDGQDFRHNCADCGDESETSTDITVCAGVRVPLCVLVDDNTITFPCLRRPLTSYATHSTAGWSSQWSIDPSSASQQSMGNTAAIRVQGDADDRIKFKAVGTDVTNGVLRIRHTNTIDQFSTGPHNPPTPSGTNSNPDYLDVTLTAYASQLGVADQNALDASGPNYGPAPIGASFGPLVLSHDDPSSFDGTGALTVWFGGSVSTNPGQQRGQYSGKFAVKFEYVN
jgi:hypothetical protein